MKKQFYILIVVLCFCLGSCQEVVPKVQTPHNDSSTIVSQDKSEQIFKKIASTIHESHQSHDFELLKSRTDASAYVIEKSRDLVFQKTQKADVIDDFSTTVSQSIISNTQSWPHSYAVVVGQNDTHKTEKLLVISQKTSHNQFKLFSYVSLFQNIKLPLFEIPKIGSAVVGVDDNLLVDKPSNILLKYASYLQGGEDSLYKSDFEDDLFSGEIFKTMNIAQKNLAPVNGSQTQTFKFRPEFFKGFRSTDGGALVVAQIDSQWVRHAGNNLKAMPASDAEQALFTDTSTSSLSAVYINVIAMYIPPLNSKKTVQILGAERFPIKVTAN